MNFWTRGSVPLTVVMITLNEAHNLRRSLDNLKGWASQVIIVDSYSSDDTVDIALMYGVHIVQRKFTGFGSQWNFAISLDEIEMPWVMKLDPDETVSPKLKNDIENHITMNESEGFSFKRRLWFMGKPLSIVQSVTRVWRSGKCRFSDVLVNEHPILDGHPTDLKGELEHHDSPNLEHWIEKQNSYSTYEAIMRLENRALSTHPSFFGDRLQRRMWLKKNFHKIPFRFFLLFIFNYVVLGAWKCGKVGYIWAHYRSEVMRLIEYKVFEVERRGLSLKGREIHLGSPDTRVRQY